MNVTNKKQFLSKASRALKLTVGCLLITPTIAAAVTDSIVSPTNTNALSTGKSGILSKVSLETSIEYSQTVAEAEQAPRSESMDLNIAPGLRINDNYKIGLRTVLSKENSEAQETKASDTILTLAVRGIKLSSTLDTLHSISAVIPTSIKSREQDRLQSAIAISNGLHFAGILWDVTYRLGYTQFFHEFNVNADGSPNMQQSLSHSLGVKFNVTDKFYLSSLGVYRWGQTYGKKERSAFEVHADLNYDVTGKMTLNLGTSNAGSALKANGVASNITAFNPDSGIIRAGISISL